MLLTSMSPLYTRIGPFIVALNEQTMGIYLQTKAIHVVSPFSASNVRVYQSSNIFCLYFFIFSHLHQVHGYAINLASEFVKKKKHHWFDFT